jgi:hypothetical protein
MEREQVIETLQSLASGAAIDDAQILEALHRASELLARPGGRRDLPPSTGARWTSEEEARLLRGFDGGTSIAALAAAHGRKAGGIRARLVKLGRLAAPPSGGAPNSLQRI